MTSTQLMKVQSFQSNGQLPKLWPTTHFRLNLMFGVCYTPLEFRLVPVIFGPINNNSVVVGILAKKEDT